MDLMLVLLSFLLVASLIFLFGSLILWIFKRIRKRECSRQARNIKGSGIVAIASFVLLMVITSGFYGDTDGGDPTTNDGPQNGTVLAQEEVVPGLTEILEMVNVDPEDAKNIEKIDDWANGPRYSFPTHGTTARVYCNMDGSIESVKVGTDIDLYRKGYEPWPIENFLIDDDLKPQLMTCAEDAVKACLNYPETADFPLLDWSFGREFDRYYVNSKVEAQNAFGVPSEIQFSAMFTIEDSSIKLIRLIVDGETVKDEAGNYPLPERAKLETKDAIGENGELRIIDGQLGEYGKAVQLDSYECFWYYVPAGTYSVTCNSKSCSVYIDKNEITRNVDGYVEMENVTTLELKYGESKEVTIHKDEHIYLTIYADITLIPVK